MVISDNPRLNTEARSAPEVDPTLLNRAQSVRLLTIFVAILSALVTIGLVSLLFHSLTPQIGALASFYAVTLLFCLFAQRVLYPRKLFSPGIIGISLLFGLSLLATSALVTGLGLPCAIVYLVFTLITSSNTPSDRNANMSIGLGILIASLSALASDYSPFIQVTIELVQILTPAIIGVLFMIYMTLQAMQFVTATLRIRLVTIFLTVVIVPLLILSIIQSQFMFSELTREAQQAQLQAAQQVAFAVDEFVSNSQSAIQEASQLDIFRRYLELAPEKRKGSPEEQEMHLTLKVLDANEIKSSIYLSSFALLDREGINLYDTLRDRIAGMLPGDAAQVTGTDLDPLLSGEGSNESGELYYIVSVNGMTYASDIEIFSSTRGFYFVSAPIRNKRGSVIGVLRARYDAQMLQDLLKQYNGLLTENSYAILLDNDNIRLADQFEPNNLFKSIAPLTPERISILKSNKALPDLPNSMLSTEQIEFNRLINNYQKKPVFATEINTPDSKDTLNDIVAVTKVRTKPWKVVYLRADFNDENLRKEQRKLTTLVTTIIAAIIGMIAVVAAHVLSNPIVQLTKTAQSISKGDLEAQAPFRGSDEFGLLSAAFNSMTSRLRTLIAELEDRVKARTQQIESQNTALSQRARQLQTVSEVARQIVSAQELEALLSSVTRLVSDRFGFYHVGVFLVDEKHEFAVLRAANSEGGQRMLARRHMLPIGKVGIVGYATGTGEARIATDVGEDAVYFNNPDLPDTRSEIALPLKVGGQVIGAMDIQSVRSNDFHEDDIELFTTLADQVAIAIYNNQLYTSTLQALNEAQNLHRQYLHSEWAQDTARRKVLGYLFNQSGITPQQAENPLWKKVFSSGDPLYAVLPSSDGTHDRAVMAVPISVRGETIGVIHVQDQGENRLWSEDEISVVNSIANQVAVALENARLFENTVRRAEREEKVLQITAKIRSTNDPEEMMRIAVSELQQALSATRTQIYIRQNDDEAS